MDAKDFAYTPAQDQDSDMALQLKGYRLTTCEILYYLPDHPSLLQSFMWQAYDLAPKFPRMSRFLDFWRREIVAVIHSVNLAHQDRIAASQWRDIAFLGRLN